MSEKLDSDFWHHRKSDHHHQRHNEEAICCPSRKVYEDFKAGVISSKEYEDLVSECVQKQLRFGEGKFIEGEAPDNWSCLVHPDKVKVRVSEKILKK